MATNLTSTYQYLGRSGELKSKSGSLKYYLLLYAKTSPNDTTGIHTVSILGRLASVNTNATFYYPPCTMEHSGTINGSPAFSGSNKPNAEWGYNSSSGTNIGGVTYKTYTDIGSGSVNVDCTNGLSKDITVSFTWKMKSNTKEDYAPAAGANATASATVTLSAIPRASSLGSIEDFAIGEKRTLSVTSLSSSFTHTVSCIVAGEEKTIAEKIEKEYEWDTGKDGDGFLWKKSAAVSGTVSGVIRLYTYSGATRVGYKDTAFNATVPAEYEGEAVAPFLSFTVSPDNSTLSKEAITTFGDVYIALKSKIRVDFDGSDYNSAIGFGSYDVTIAGKTYSSTDPSEIEVTTPEAITASGTVPVTVAIRDKSGRKAETTENITVSSYSLPAVKNIDCYRAVQNGDVWEHNQTGTSVFVVASRQLESIGEKNKGSLKYEVFNAGSSVEIDSGFCLTADGKKMDEDEPNNDAAFVIPKVVFEMENAYTIRLIAEDLLGKGQAYSVNISVSTPTWHALAGGKGFALGMQAAEEGFHNAFDAYFYKGLSFVDADKNKAPLADFVVEQGISDGWTWRKWNSGIAECWCKKSLDVGEWKSPTTNVHYSETKPSLSFPFTFFSVPTVSGQFSNAGAYIFTSLQAVSEKSCGFVFGRTAGGIDTISGNLHVYAIGTWK